MTGRRLSNTGEGHQPSVTPHPPIENIMKINIVPALLALTTLTSLGAQASTHFEVARVLSSEPIYERIRTEDCRDIPVTRTQPASGENHLGGTLVGGLVGGLLGSQVGGGHGRDLAIAAGAVTGGLVGNNVAGAPRTVTDSRRECRDRTEDRLKGYAVTYEYQGHREIVTLPTNPGPELQLRVTAEPYLGPR